MMLAEIKFNGTSVGQDRLRTQDINWLHLESLTVIVVCLVISIVHVNGRIF